MLFKYILSAIALARLAISAQASPIESSLTQKLAAALSVTVTHVTMLENAKNLSIIDVKP